MSGTKSKLLLQVAGWLISVSLDDFRARWPNREAKHLPERSPSHRSVYELSDPQLLICGDREAPLQNEHENFLAVARDVFLRCGIAPGKW
jgi:hypothetical protein